MPKSATGATDRESAGRQHGFTLVEVLVVVVIAGVMTALAVLSMGGAGPAERAERELARLEARLDALCEGALLTGTVRGARFRSGGYDFWVLRSRTWQPLTAADAPSAGAWPDDLSARITVEGQMLSRGREPTGPQVMCSGIEPATPTVVELGAGDARRRLRWPG